ncbi:unnamed protein product [Polarella glacialis]|uniref:Glutathione transferase n=1 Tax=Polarella glacialis TaxID=89957 RepID=A0A813JN60_POLGL|nr:unnamed protein product [Polarella glacialis]CAE8682800.1 unnamed protein product [Polarella glacialis]|eukprot:CAMPEP_0115091172 /NCGR_PEP_ID=MMETSP0227-20121206/25928_1 /TAXON_ID=89957 /ORGANISM="Polarella glacialis, Strain CCMP 1383" /LENGTH=213 /DNA_ID=CAMNT_0002482581 /DNA_START=64 /DNA_END=705 /DNA_ORIENTATION=+
MAEKRESDYNKMGMGSANLYVVYPMFGLVFSVPGIIGACSSLFWASNPSTRAKVSTLANNSMGPLYISLFFYRMFQTMINANLGTARRACAINVPDQQVYKVVGGAADQSLVLMDDEHALFGPFNRAQRALQNLNENLPLLMADFLLTGFVFPWSTSLCAAFNGLFRYIGAVGYTRDRNERTKGNMTAGLFLGAIQGMSMTIGAYATYLELKA